MIYLISNCTNSKKLLVETSLLFRNYMQLNFSEAVLNWTESKKNSKSSYLQAIDMYKGTSWKAVKDAKTNLAKIDNVKLLISSAGYGLINSSRNIQAYGITFTSNHLDSISNICNTKNINAKWWDSINDFDITTLDTNAKVIISVSYEYLIAMEATIKEIIKLYKDKVFIINLSNKKVPKFYEKNLITFDTRFNHFEKGTMSSILARFTRWLSNEIVKFNLELDHVILQTYINDFLNKFDKYTVKMGKQLEDSDMIKIINDQIITKNIKTKTNGLKDIRLMGYACEQNRYGKLYNTVLEQLS